MAVKAGVIPPYCFGIGTLAPISCARNHNRPTFHDGHRAAGKPTHCYFTPSAAPIGGRPMADRGVRLKSPLGIIWVNAAMKRWLPKSVELEMQAALAQMNVD